MKNLPRMTRFGLIFIMAAGIKVIMTLIVGLPFDPFLTSINTWVAGIGIVLVLLGLMFKTRRA